MEKESEKFGLYKLTGHSCIKAYIGQTEQNLNTRYKEHCGYIETNNPKSVYVLHILNNKHQYGSLPLAQHIQNPSIKAKC